MKDFMAWCRGWRAGASVGAVENDLDPEYSAGWAAGRKAFREAMEIERARRGLPPSAVIRTMDPAPAPEVTCGMCGGSKRVRCPENAQCGDRLEDDEPCPYPEYGGDDSSLCTIPCPTCGMKGEGR